MKMEKMDQGSGNGKCLLHAVPERISMSLIKIRGIRFIYYFFSSNVPVQISREDHEQSGRDHRRSIPKLPHEATLENEEWDVEYGLHHPSYIGGYIQTITRQPKGM